MAKKIREVTKTKTTVTRTESTTAGKVAKGAAIAVGAALVLALVAGASSSEKK